MTFKGKPSIAPMAPYILFCKWHACSVFLFHSNKEDLAFERLREAAIVVIAAPREKFSKPEVGLTAPACCTKNCIQTAILISPTYLAFQLAALSAYLTGGGSVLVMSAEGGDGKQGSNIGDFTSEFGIIINGDIVLRTVFYKYLHPKEAFVSRGCLSKPFGAAVTRVQVWMDGSRGWSVRE